MFCLSPSLAPHQCPIIPAAASAAVIIVEIFYNGLAPDCADSPILILKLERKLTPLCSFKRELIWIQRTRGPPTPDPETHLDFEPSQRAPGLFCHVAIRDPETSASRCYKLGKGHKLNRTRTNSSSHFFVSFFFLFYRTCISGNFPPHSITAVTPLEVTKKDMTDGKKKGRQPTLITDRSTHSKFWWHIICMV